MIPENPFLQTGKNVSTDSNRGFGQRVAVAIIQTTGKIGSNNQAARNGDVWKWESCKGRERGIEIFGIYRLDYLS
jgi:hypothetical protein